MKLSEANIKKMESQLKLWNSKIDQFELKSQKSNGWSKIEIRQRIDDLKIMRALVRVKLDEYNAARSDHREEAKDGLVRAWKDLQAAFKRLGK